MPQTERGIFLFADARSLHADALEMLSQGRLRNAAEKAWCATKRATDALILERTSREPTRTSQTSSGINLLAREDAELEWMKDKYHECARFLHSQCFYGGECEPADFITSLVLETADYIRGIESAADNRKEGDC